MNRYTFTIKSAGNPSFESLPIIGNSVAEARKILMRTYAPPQFTLIDPPVINYYRVGGWVRDRLMGLDSKDVDFAVEAPSYEAMKLDLLSKGIKIFQERPQFLTIRGNHPEFGGVDYVLCRKDGKYSDGRRPDSVEIGTLLDDLARRDFTCNAIAMDECGAVIDPYGGKADIEKYILRCVGDTRTRLQEDSLRILRAIRFHITKGFQFHKELEDVLAYGSDTVRLLETVSDERIREELYKCFAFDTLKTLKVLTRFPLVQWQCFAGNRIQLEPTLKRMS